MPKITIDGRAIEVESGCTVLAAARRMGLDIPALCSREGMEPFTACMVCLVKDTGLGRLRPSCAVRTEDGMVIESETDAVGAARRAGLELLLSEHVGDCEGPCERACPARMRIPLMLRQIAAGETAKALATAKQDLALPGVLGRICPAPCEKACRRGRHDQSVAIRLLERYAADADRASAVPLRAPPAAASGRCVAVVGAGPAGLSAAYYLARDGHRCVLMDSAGHAGGALRSGVSEDALPRDVLDAEIGGVLGLGVEFRAGVHLGRDVGLDELERTFDAVVVAVGECDAGWMKAAGLAGGPKGIKVDARTLATNRPRVFACGAAIGMTRKMAVRAVGDGRIAAFSIGQLFAGAALEGRPRLFQSTIGKIEPEEMERFLAGANRGEAVPPAGGPEAGLTAAEASPAALRCLHCDCRKPESCRLRLYSGRYGADASRYRGESRKPIEIVRQHARVVYEPGKCIRCGLCVRITERAREPLGLTFVGRGFDVTIGVPFGEPLERALRETAAECVSACPTGALAFADAEEGPTA